MRTAVISTIVGIFILGTVLSVQADLANEYCLEGDQLYKAEKYRKAEEKYLSALEFDAKCAPAHYSLGLLYLRNLDQPDKAAEHFKKHLEIRPDFTIVREWLEEADNLVFFRALERKKRIFRMTKKDMLNPNSLEWVRPDMAMFEGKHSPENDVRDTEEDREQEVENIEEFAIIAFKDLKGRIMSTDGKEVVIDIGSSDGVTPGTEFSVYRKDQWIGLITVVSTSESESACSVTAGKQAGIDESVSWSFKAGDEVHQREDVVGTGMALEAKARKTIIGWQKEQQKYENQFESFQEKEKALEKELALAESAAAFLETAREYQKIQMEYRDWKKTYIGWVEEILKIQEKKLAGNWHITAYREKIRKRKEVEEMNSYWKEIHLDILTDLLETLKIEDPWFEAEEKALKILEKSLETRAGRLRKRIDKFNSQIYSRSRSEYESIKKEIANVNMSQNNYAERAKQYNKQLEIAQSKRLEQVKAILTAMNEAVEDSERWQAEDGIYSFLENEKKRIIIEALLNLGRYSILGGNDRKAKRIFQNLMSMNPGDEYQQTVRDGLELALLKVILKGEDTVENTGFTPPLKELWKTSSDGFLLGQMKTCNGLLYGFFYNTENEENSFLLRARKIATGEMSWEFPVAGRPMGKWVLQEDEIVFASRDRVLYRIDAENGTLLNRWTLKEKNDNYSSSSVERVDTGIYWFGSLSSEQNPENIMVYYIDLENSKKSWSATVEGTVKNFTVSGNCLYITARKPVGKNLWNYVTGSSWPDTAKSRCAVPGKLISWMSVCGNYLVINVTDKERGGEGKSGNDICFTGLANKNLKSQRISLEGRDAVSDMRTDGETAYILVRDGYLIAMDTEKMSVLWTADVMIPSSQRSHYTQFLHIDENELVIFGGSRIPPWKVYVIDKEEGLVSGEATIYKESLAKPIYRNGFLYMVSRDGYLNAIDLAVEDNQWTYKFEKEKTLFLPRSFNSGEEEIVWDGIFVASYDDWQEEVFKNTYENTRAGNIDPLIFADDTLIFYSHRNKQIYAFGSMKEEQ